MRPAVLAVLALAGCGGSPCGPASATVSHVVDGDTVDLDTGVRVRMLLVNTPETNTNPVQCYGLPAKEATVAALEGKQVSLTYDDAQCKDMFDRTLAYIKVDGKDFNLELVQKGLACAYYVAPGGKSRQQEFDDAEAVAKTDRTGLWGFCTGKIECDK